MNLAMQLLVAGHSSAASGELCPPQAHSTNPFLTTDGTGKYILNWANSDTVYSGVTTQVEIGGVVVENDAAGSQGADDTYATGSAVAPSNPRVRHRDPDGRVSDWFNGAM